MTSLLKFHHAYFLVLVLRGDSVFKDLDNARETWQLAGDMFTVPHPVLDDSERASINGLIEALHKTQTHAERVNILEGRKGTSWGAAQDALKKWARKQRLNALVYQRVDEVLSVNESTPKQLIQLGEHEGDFPAVADVEGYKEDVALALFGRSILESKFRGVLRDAMSSIMHHAWERHRKCFQRARSTMQSKAAKARAAVKVLEDAPSVTPAMVKSAVSAVAAYADAIAWFPAENDAADGVNELQEIIKDVTVNVVAKVRKVTVQSLLGDDVPNPARQRGKVRASKIKAVQVSHPGDVDQMWTLYMQLYRLPPGQSDPVSISLDDEPTGHAQWTDTPDTLGIGQYAAQKDEQLHTALNFPGGRPALFATFRSRSGLCAWDKGNASRFVEGNPDMQPLSLLWHQCAGVAALVAKVFTASATAPTDNTGASSNVTPQSPGVIIADAVGVGKTALSMGWLAFVIDAYWWKHRDEAPRTVDTSKFRPAPILAQFPYFAGSNDIPNLPHIIVVPNSLVGQWNSELLTFFAPNAIEIYRYPTASKEFGPFWEGDWRSSKVPLINRVILVSHSVFSTAGRCFELRKAKRGENAGKAADAKRHVSAPDDEAQCLWAKNNFLNCIVDEAHEFRNMNSAFYALLETTRSSSVRLLLTATPLYTCPKDLHSLGRLARVAAFCGQSGDDDEHEHWKRLRNARRNITPEDRKVSEEHQLRKLNGETGARPFLPSMQALTNVMEHWVNDIKRRFGDRVIRRTIQSKRFDGRMINDSLPPCLTIDCPVYFDERSAAVIEEIMTRILNDKKTEGIDDESRFNKKFYLEGRTKVAFPWYSSPIYPVVENMQEYRDHPSPKMDMLISILYHHLSTDDVDPVHFHKDLRCTKDRATGQCHALWRTESDRSPRPLTEIGTTKILVYHQFPMMVPLITSILRLFNINVLVLNGTQTAEERVEVVKKFNTDPQARVLLFSAVGAVGLNLTAAHIVILFDQCWSRMLVLQIAGRAWRLGQTKTVLLYNLIGIATVDMLMGDYAQAKGDMLHEFLSPGVRNIAALLRRAADGRMNEGEDADDDLSTTTASAATAKPKKAKQTKAPKSSKSVAAVPDNSGHHLNSAVMSEDQSQTPEIPLPAAALDPTLEDLTMTPSRITLADVSPDPDLYMMSPWRPTTPS
ncbi:hypothetical protein HYDPIDRAFT_34751, partial [Hydnomerulius pinastri MD-312]